MDHVADDELRLPAGITATELDLAVTKRDQAPAIAEVPIEQQFTEETVVAQTSSSHTAVRREQRLVLEYAAFLEKQDHEVVRFRIHPAGEAREIISDLYDKTTNSLVEAKSSGTRGEIRMAVGQLVDYSRFIHPSSGCAVLLPHQPRQDLADLLRAADVSAIWPVDDGFTDNADGRYVS